MVDAMTKRQKTETQDLLTIADNGQKIDLVDSIEILGATPEQAKIVRNKLRKARK
jgi:hypothetical protein